MTTPKRPSREKIAPLPRPWKYEAGRLGVMVIGNYNGRKYFIAEVLGRNQDERKANARFIVQAANSHEALLGAVKTLVDYAHSPDFDGAPSNMAIWKAEAAISLAEKP